MQAMLGRAVGGEQGSTTLSDSIWVRKKRATIPIESNGSSKSEDSSFAQLFQTFVELCNEQLFSHSPADSNLSGNP